MAGALKRMGQIRRIFRYDQKLQGKSNRKTDHSMGMGHPFLSFPQVDHKLFQKPDMTDTLIMRLDCIYRKS